MSDDVWASLDPTATTHAAASHSSSDIPTNDARTIAAALSTSRLAAQTPASTYTSAVNIRNETPPKLFPRGLRVSENSLAHDFSSSGSSAEPSVGTCHSKSVSGEGSNNLLHDTGVEASDLATRHLSTSLPRVVNSPSTKRGWTPLENRPGVCRDPLETSSVPKRRRLRGKQPASGGLVDESCTAAQTARVSSQEVCPTRVATPERGCQEQTG